jgi:phosphoglucomutase
MLRPRPIGVVSKQSLHNTAVTSVDAAAVYARTVSGLFDLPLIQRYLASSSLFVSFDCMHGVARRYLDPVLQTLGVDLACCYLNQVARPDFDGCIPSASAEHCSSSISLFNAQQLVHADDGVLDAGVPADCPDLGFVVDADVSRCLVR